MNEKQLKEIKDSIEFQMICEQNAGYKKEYSPMLQEEIALYNEVIRTHSLIENATSYYYKTLSQYNNQNKKMPDEAVEMFNLLENNK